MRIGVDIGGTKADGVALDGDDVIARVRMPARPGVAGVVSSILDVVDALCRQANAQRADVGFLGIGVPGQVRKGQTVVTHALNLGLDGVDLAVELGRHLAAVVAVDNDVNAAALGISLERLHAHGPESLAYLNIGTGVAAAVVSDGAVWSGSSGVAGEIGHLSIDPAGPQCGCGQRGCIETYLGGRALGARWGSTDPIPIVAMFDAADLGDRRAVAMVAEMIDALRMAINVLALAVDADAIVLGGGVTTLGDRLLVPLHARLADEASRSPFIASLDLAARISVLASDSSACARGAASLHRPALSSDSR